MSSSPEEDLCEYEMQRLKNMADNKEKLRELGLLDDNSVAQPKKPLHKKTKPTRSSRRQKGVNLEIDWDQTGQNLDMMENNMGRMGRRKQPERSRRPPNNGVGVYEEFDDDEDVKPKPRRQNKSSSSNGSSSSGSYNSVDQDKELAFLFQQIYNNDDSAAKDVAIKTLIEGRYPTELLEHNQFPAQICLLNKTFWCKHKTNGYEDFMLFMLKNCQPGETCYKAYEGYDGPFYKSFLRYRTQIISSAASSSVQISDDTATTAKTETAETAIDINTIQSIPVEKQLDNNIMKGVCPVCRNRYSINGSGQLRKHEKCAENALASDPKATPEKIARVKAMSQLTWYVNGKHWKPCQPCQLGESELPKLPPMPKSNASLPLPLPLPASFPPSVLQSADDPFMQDFSDLGPLRSTNTTDFEKNRMDRFLEKFPPLTEESTIGPSGTVLHYTDNVEIIDENGNSKLVSREAAKYFWKDFKGVENETRDEYAKAFWKEQE